MRKQKTKRGEVVTQKIIIIIINLGQKEGKCSLKNTVFLFLTTQALAWVGNKTKENKTKM